MDYEQQTEHYLARTEQMLNEAFGEKRYEWLHRMEAELPRDRDQARHRYFFIAGKQLCLRLLYT